MIINLNCVLLGCSYSFYTKKINESERFYNIVPLVYLVKRLPNSESFLDNFGNSNDSSLIFYMNECREVGRILRFGGPKKIPEARLFPSKFFDFLERNPRILGYFEP